MTAEAEPKDLESLGRWHRQQARAAADPVDREFHTRAARLISTVIKRRTDHTARIKEGVARAHAAGRVGGRARIDPAIENRVRVMLADGATVRTIMAETGAGASTVYRIKAGMEADAE